MHLSLLFCEKCFSPIQCEQFLLKILVFLYFLAGLQLELILYFLSVYCLIVVTSTVLLMAEKSRDFLSILYDIGNNFYSSS